MNQKSKPSNAKNPDEDIDSNVFKNLHQTMSSNKKIKDFLKLFKDYTTNTINLSESELNDIQDLISMETVQELKGGVNLTRLQIVLSEIGEAAFLKLALLLEENTIHALIKRKKIENKFVSVSDVSESKKTITSSMSPSNRKYYKQINPKSKNITFSIYFPGKKLFRLMEILAYILENKTYKKMVRIIMSSKRSLLIGQVYIYNHSNINFYVFTLIKLKLND
jgi:hypothetical protein